jgi:GTP pyrophosphokinase
MHRHAELGVAAHWLYKEGGGSRDRTLERKITWLRRLLDPTDTVDDADLLERLRSEAFEDQVYVLTPRGRVVDLPTGATPLDFAYQVHTEIGHRCRGAKVDGRIVPLTYELKTGEQVEILTAKEGGPSRDWLSPYSGYLKTAGARGKVRQWFNRQELEKNATAGRSAVERELKRLGVANLDLGQLAKRFNLARAEELFAAVGRGDIGTAQIAGAVQEQVLPPSPPETPAVPIRPSKSRGEPGQVRIQGVGNLLTTFAQCCRPVPPDPIIGFITRGRGVTVHRCDCPNVLNMDEEQSVRLVEVSWGDGSSPGSVLYPVEVHVEAVDRQGLLRDIANVLSNEKINVLAVNTGTNKDEHMAHMRLTIEVRDAQQLSRALDRIGQVRNVLDVGRVR